MTFNELKKAMEDNFGIIRLADIAREFDVSPQVINNWKSRDQVPYKYVKIYNKLILEKNKDIEKTTNYALPNPFHLNSKNDEDDINLTEYFFSLLRYLFAYKYLIVSLVSLSMLYSYIYIHFTSVPLYETEATILPIGGGSISNVSSIASQFGISVSDGDGGVDLSSGKLVPEVIKSRKLARSVLDYKFDTKKYGKEKKFISIMMGDTLTEIFSERDLRRSVKLFRGKINVKVQKRSPLLIIRLRGSDKVLLPKLLDAIIEELKNIVSNFKLSKSVEKKKFIGLRLHEVKESLKSAEKKYQRFKETNRKILNSPSLIIDEQRLLREIELQSQIYIALKSEYEMTQVEEAGMVTSIQILDKPEIPLKKLSPKPFQVYVSGLIISIVACFVIIALREWMLLNKKGLKISNPPKSLNKLFLRKYLEQFVQ